MDTKKTKSFNSAMKSAPVLSGTEGSLISLLDAVLVTGFGLVPVTGLSVLAGIATVTVSAGHPLMIDSVGLIAGATPAGLNGEKRILSIATNAFTFDAAGIADGAASGAISAKAAGAGWIKAFTGTNLAAYKSSSVEGTGFYIRVDDTGTTAARVRGYETMSDINTGTGLFPTAMQAAESGLWWSKSNTASTAARPWHIVADNRGVFYFPKCADVTYEHQGNYFGDFESLKSNDPYSCVLRWNINNKSALVGGSFGDDLIYADSTGSYDGMFAARAANALGGAVNIHSAPVLDTGAGATVNHVTGSKGYPYPAAVDNGLILTPVLLHNASGIRGYLPGISYSPQVVNTAFGSGEIVAGSGALVGKKVTAIRLGSLSAVPAQCGIVFIDTTADWRV